MNASVTYPASLLVGLTLCFGILQVISESQVVAQAKVLCCNVPNNCHNELCTKTVGAQLKGSCGDPDVYISCKTCVDYTLSGCLCPGSMGSSYCKNADQSLYYGTLVDCPAK